MKRLYLLLAILAVCSCAPTVPRAIVVPKSEIAKIETSGVRKASNDTRTAVRGVGAASDKARAELEKLKDKEVISRADLTALDLALSESEKRNKDALAAIDRQDSEIANLLAQVAAQGAQIDNASRVEDTLRVQVEGLSKASDKLAVAQDRLRVWRKRAFLLGGLCLLLVIFILRRPILALIGVRLP